jgi:hypothetical protein
MVKDQRSMQKKVSNRRTILSQRLLQNCLSFCLYLLGISVVAARGDQSFAVALPELEGPVTLGIFSKEGALIRLLYRDAPMDSIPAGLNGLIMTWDEKDDQGRPVEAGSYLAKGMVHGPLSISSLPFSEPAVGLPSPDWPSSLTSKPLQKNSIAVHAPKDALLENTPLITIAASIKENTCTVTAEGLPILSFPLKNDALVQRVRVLHGIKEGNAHLMLDNPEGTIIYEIIGLNRLVPLSAGKLEVSPDAFHLSPSAGESTP